MLVPLLAIALVALAVAAIAGAVLSGGDDGSSSSSNTPATTPAKKKEPPAKKKSKAEKPKKSETPAAPAPSGDESSYDPARGAQLNSQGFDLMGQGNYDAAIPVLRQAVDSFPPGTSDVNYAYALFNLGKSLRLAGQYDEAVKVLEQRLKIPNQTETVQRELDLAKQQSSEK
jgi:tetratricopeptide (TPR) repeat protein